MEEEIVVLRPHHIDRFVNYCYDLPNPFNNANLLSIVQKKYGDETVKKIRELYDWLSSDKTGKVYVLVKSGLDRICEWCPIHQDPQDSCLEPDSLSEWNGSGAVMREMGLREGFLYPLEDFRKRIEGLYPYENCRFSNEERKG